MSELTIRNVGPRAALDEDDHGCFRDHFVAQCWSPQDDRTLGAWGHTPDDAVAKWHELHGLHRPSFDSEDIAT